MQTPLPNNCRAGNVSVYPSNWKTANAKLRLTWRISYWFYDDNINQKRKVVIKGMNRAASLQEKRQKVKLAIEHEMHLLQHEGYNPITNVSYMPGQRSYEIETQTGFIKALEKAREKVNTCMADLRTVIKYTTKAARQLDLHNVPISLIKRRDIKMIMQELPKIKKRWSANTFNYYRAHLIILFNELLEYDAVDFNPVKEIKKMKTTVCIRETLSREQRKEVDQHLRKLKMMRFRIFIKLFFHSGMRITEMLALKGKDVYLERQLLKCMIKKGRGNIEKYKPIKTIAVRYWKLAVAGCGPDDYIFSYRLKPGKKLILPEQVTRRWKRSVKDIKTGGLGITSDFYALKHGNTTEMVDRLGEEDAAELNSHKGTAMVRKIYDTKQVTRQQARIMGADNEF